MIESGSRRAPVCERREAEADREVERDDEEEARLHEVLEEEHDQAAGQLAVAQHPGTDERLLAPVLAQRASQRKNSQITNRPTRISQIVGERLHQAGWPGFGWIQPQSLERSTPKTSSAEAGCGQHRADDVELRAVLRGRVRDLAREHEDRETITTSPANTQRQEK